MDDKDLLALVHELVAEEHELRDRLSHGEISLEEEHARLGELERQLDECWDLLRERRARRDAGLAPGEPLLRESEGADFLT